jgi:chromosome segregation ATPase
MYMRGEGVRKDKKTAKALLAKSCSLGDSQSCAPAPQRLSFSDVLNMALPALNAMADSNSNSNSGSSSASASSSAYSSASAQNSRSSGGSNVAFLKNQIQRLQNEIARNEKNVSEWESSKTGNPAAIAGLRRSIQKEREQLLGFQAQLARAQQ